jgi:hypothetical protein
MKYVFITKLKMAILGILLITWFSYYIGDKIREYQDLKFNIKENFDPTSSSDWKNLFINIVKSITRPFEEMVNGIDNVFKGMDYHFSCGSKTLAGGYSKGLKVLGIHFDCAINKTKGFFDGSCTLYYIVNIIFGILYILIVELPLLLLNIFFGTDFHYAVDLIKDVIIMPIDEMMKSTIGISITQWSDRIKEKCFLCPGDIGGGMQYKSFGEWGEYYKCTTALINKGSYIMTDSIINAKRWANWYKEGNVRDWGDWNLKD